MQNIPVQLLYSFVAFAESDSIAEAAAKVGVTQPALSKQLKALQQLVPQALFAASGKRKILTPFGCRLHSDLKQRLSDLQDLVRQSINFEVSPLETQVRIHARREILDRLVNRVVFPGKIIFTEGNHQEILLALKNRKSDLGITHAAPDVHDLIAKPLFREKFQIVIPKSLVSRIPSARDFSIALQKVPCLAYKEQDEILRRACVDRGLDFTTIRFTRIISDYSAIAKMVESGFGWSVIPLHFQISQTKNWSLELNSPAFHLREFQTLYRPEMSKAAWLKGLLSEISGCFRA